MRIIEALLSALVVLGGSGRARSQGKAEEAIDCSSDELVTSIFNDPIDLNFNGNVRVYENVTIDAITLTSNNEFDRNYIDARLESNAESGNRSMRFIIFTTESFPVYALEQTSTRLSLKVTIGCEGGRRERTLIFFVPIKEGNYFRPKFSQDVYEIALPTPIFSGYDLSSFTEIFARDFDVINNRITFTSENSSAHGIRVTGRNSSSADAKTFYAGIVLERSIVRLKREFSFDILATDSGFPPMTSSAVVIVRTDVNNSLPPLPQFEQELLNAYLNENLELAEHLNVLLTSDSYSDTVNFSLTGMNHQLFAWQRIPTGVEISLLNPLSVDEVANRTFLELEVRAHLAIAPEEYRRAMIIVAVPPVRESFRFNRSFYDGQIYIDSNDSHLRLNLPEIEFLYTYKDHDLVNFTLIGAASGLFRLTINSSVLRINVIDDFPLQSWSSSNFLSIELQASLSGLKSIVPVVIGLPRSNQTTPVTPALDTQPEFEKPLYMGRINDNRQLLIEQIVLLPYSFEPQKTQFSLIGSVNNIFDIKVTENIVRLVIRTMPWVGRQDIAVSSAPIYLTLVARNNQLKAQTTLVIEQNTTKSAETEAQPKRIFASPWLMGKVTLDDADNQGLIIDNVALLSDYNVNEFTFGLVGAEFDHFGVTAIPANNSVKIFLQRPLPSDELMAHSLLSLQLNAMTLNDGNKEDSALVFIEMPRPECNVRPIGNNSMPSFSSDSYVFTAQPNQLGVLGRVNAIVEGSNARIRYNLNVESQNLQQRLAINSDSGELMLLSYALAGSYNFSISAENTETFEKTTVQARLDVDKNMMCDVGRVTVPYALLVLHIAEEQKHDAIMNLTLGECHYEVINVRPDGRDSVFMNETTGTLATWPIDRESEMFANMSVPQIEVTLRLECPTGRENRSGLLREVSPRTFDDLPAIYIGDIQHSDIITILRLIIDDVNDNPPKFVQPSRTTYIGYPDQASALELFPEFLTQVKAIDPDEGLNARVRYSMRPNLHFSIDPVSGVVYPRAIALKTESFTELVIIAVDMDGDAGGHSTGVVLLVQRLSSKYFSLMTVEGRERRQVDELTAQWSNRSGYAISPLKHATIPDPGNISVSGNEARVRRIDDDSVVQKVWAYAFARSKPITCEELQEKIASIPDLNQTLTVQTFDDVVSAMATGNDNSTIVADPIIDAKSALYIIAIIMVLMIGLACLGFFMWRLCLRNMKFCNRKSTPPEYDGWNCPTNSRPSNDSTDNNAHVPSPLRPYVTTLIVSSSQSDADADADADVCFSTNGDHKNDVKISTSENDRDECPDEDTYDNVRHQRKRSLSGAMEMF